MSHVTRIFGPPGTGKTTTLLKIVEEAMQEGISPESIAYVSFSRKAAEEAVSRAKDKFGFPKDRFRYFKTLHSIGYTNLGIQEGMVLQPSDKEAIATSLGMRVTKYRDEEDTSYGVELGDQCDTIYNLSRNKMVALQDEWRRAEDKINVPFMIVQQWADTVKQYKQERKIYDFTDMLELYSGVLPVDLFIVDEAQDLSRLQWHVVHQAAANADRIYLAGDDDQCIFNWNGADLESFLQFRADKEIVLPHSHRVPKGIMEICSIISKRITGRKDKEWHPKEAPGRVIRNLSLEHLPLESGEWLILGRNVKLLKEIEHNLEERGLLYRRTRGSKVRSIDPDDAGVIRDWQFLKTGGRLNSLRATAICRKIDARSKRLLGDNFTMEKLPIPEHFKKMEWYQVFSKGMKPKYIEYIRSCLRNGSKLGDKPRITVSTIHKVKGGECDNVAILPDMAYATYQDAHLPSEHRVWYVGVTRAKENLFLLDPMTDLFYRF